MTRSLDIFRAASTYLVVVIAGLACSTAKGVGPPSAEGGVGGTPGDGGIEGDANGCAVVGLVVEQRNTCADCPAPPICRCTSDLGLDRCNYGRCIVSLDCGWACRAFDEAGAVTADSLLIFNELFHCASEALTPHCDGDALCPGGRCVGESKPGGGLCQNGARFAPCEDGGDCLSAKCVFPPEIATFDSPGTCTDGQTGSPCAHPEDCISGACIRGVTEGAPVCGDRNVGSPCNTGADCASGKCILGGLSTGMCTEGRQGQACAVPEDCVTFTCTAGPGAIGICSTGSPGEPCLIPSQCMSNFCVKGSCSSGTLDALCVTGQDCSSGYCNNPNPTLPIAAGHCVSGERGTSCVTDLACRSGYCAFASLGSRPLGLCTDGAPGDPCGEGADCVSGSCTSARPPDPCQTPVSIPCGDGGVCAGDRACHYDRCD